MSESLFQAEFRRARLGLQAFQLLFQARDRLDGVPIVGKLVHLPVQSAELRHGIATIGVSIEKVLVAINDHSELRAPIADVIVTLDFVAHELEESVQGRTDERAADMADVHRLGHVGRGIIDQDDFGICGRLDAKAVVLDEPAGRRFNPIRSESEIDKAGPGNLGGKTQVGDVQPRDDPFGNRSRSETQLLRQRHGAVGLEIAETRVLRRLDETGQRRRILRHGFECPREAADGVPTGGSCTLQTVKIRLPIDRNGVRPQIFQVVKLPCFGSEDVQHNIAEILQDPGRFGGPLVREAS